MKLSEKQKKGIIIGTICVVVVGGILGIVFGVVLSHRSTAVQTVAPTSPPTSPPHAETSPPKTTAPYKGKCVFQKDNGCLVAITGNPCKNFQTGDACENYEIRFNPPCRPCKWMGTEVENTRQCYCRARKDRPASSSAYDWGIATAPNPKNKFSNAYVCANVYPQLTTGQNGCNSQNDDWCQGEDTMTPAGCEGKTDGNAGNRTYGYKDCTPCEWVKSTKGEWKTVDGKMRFIWSRD